MNKRGPSALSHSNAYENTHLNKRGVSIMIGYVLLIVIALALALLSYRYIVTYVPTEAPSCPDGVAIVVESITCIGTDISFVVENDGLFSIDRIDFQIGEVDRITTQSLNEDEQYQIINDDTPDAILSPGERMTPSYTHSESGEVRVVVQPIIYTEDNTPSICTQARVARTTTCT